MKYVVADDHFSVHMAVKAILQTHFGASSESIVDIRDGDALLDQIRTGGFTNALLVLDLSMPGRFRRLLLVEALLTIEPSLRIVVNTADTSAHLARDLMQRGVVAYVTKSRSEPLIQGIAAGIAGDVYVDPAIDLEGAARHPWSKLTPSQKAVVIDVCRDLSNEDIAYAHGVTTNTVSAHKRQAMAKLGVTKDSLLSRYLVENGLTYLLDE